MKSCNKMGVGFKTVIIDELPDFNERARKFKEAVLKAEKKYGVRIGAGYINSWDDEGNLLITEHNDLGETINEVYFNTLRKEL